MYLHGDWSQRFETAVVLRSRIDQEGRESLLVRLTGPDDLVFTVEVDVESGRLSEVRSVEPVPNLGGLPVTTRFEDWREVGGIALPFRVVTENDASGRTVIQFTEAETGVEVDPETYRHSPWR